MDPTWARPSRKASLSLTPTLPSWVGVPLRLPPPCLPHHSPQCIEFYLVTCQSRSHGHSLWFLSNSVFPVPSTWACHIVGGHLFTQCILLITYLCQAQWCSDKTQPPAHGTTSPGEARHRKLRHFQPQKQPQRVSEHRQSGDI